MKKINLAFAGFRHGHAIGFYNTVKERDDICICGAFEENEEARKAAAEKGVVFDRDSLEEILDDKNVGAVFIGERYGVRGELALKILNSGKSVFADKPLCTSLTQAEKIKKTADEKHLAVGLMLDLRGSKSIRIAADAVKKGIIGKVNNIVFEAQHPLNYGSRPGWYFEKNMHGGTINDIAVHGIDIVRLLTGSDVESVVGARTWNFYADKCPYFNDSAQLMVKMADGTGVVGDVSYAAPGCHGYSHPAYWHFRVWGKNGMMDFSPSCDCVKIYPADSEEIITLTDTDSEYDYIADFIKAVNDEEYRLKYNADILAVTEQTLKIQHYADKEVI